ncbi:MAG: 2,3-bisphosphoglycerate-independent phosphoglycerate mutase [Coriobacteriales bacterium]|jgi:2,3-bisphosphoglycerate-independent phosphoglycerate mutase|nr:2,3-bisphosphoglycerate-independent phosphoglycerate mutase [Coriobacteriales bacterium]
MRTPALLAILDGVGIREATADNAVARADAPFLHALFADALYPCRSIAASGRDVGLPDGQMGNSEVGHLNIGAGRIVAQELTRIDEAIAEGSLHTNAVLAETMDALIARQSGSLHLMGLLSDGGVHSMQSHLEALVTMAAERGVRRIRLHAFLDGRDVAPASAKAFVERARDFCRRLAGAHPGLDLRISTLAGRYFAMDRDNRWERVCQAWRALVEPGVPGAGGAAEALEAHETLGAAEAAEVLETPGAGASPGAGGASALSALPCYAADADPAAIVQASYDAGITDEFFEPVAIGEDGISDGDAVIFFNLRPDRARELTRAFIDPGFSLFERRIRPKVDFVCMTEYDPVFERDFGAKVAFPKQFPVNTLADYLASLHLRQFHIAETEKYAHVTFFLNGGIEEPKEGEERLLIASPRVATYDLEPEMSAPQVTEQLVGAIRRSAADVYIVNYANGDMVGHTGVQAATEAAICAVDRGLKRVCDAISAKGGVALVTADHGNAEQMLDANGRPWTAHTTSPVPLVYVDVFNQDRRIDLRRDGDGRLADVAPTLLDAMDLPIPEQWTGRSLLLRH